MKKLLLTVFALVCFGAMFHVSAGGSIEKREFLNTKITDIQNLFKSLQNGQYNQNFKENPIYDRTEEIPFIIELQSKISDVFTNLSKKTSELMKENWYSKECIELKMIAEALILYYYDKATNQPLRNYSSNIADEISNFNNGMLTRYQKLAGIIATLGETIKKIDGSWTKSYTYRYIAELYYEYAVAVFKIYGKLLQESKNDSTAINKANNTVTATQDKIRKYLGKQ